MVQRDIDTKKGWIKIHCAGGCIQLYKVRYNCCFNGMEPVPKDLAIANDLCKDKQKCQIRNLGKMCKNVLNLKNIKILKISVEQKSQNILT